MRHLTTREKRLKMSSSYGARYGLAGYDRFRTGLDFASVQRMLRVPSDDPLQWRRKSRGVVLGLWHEIKLALWSQAQDVLAGTVQREYQGDDCLGHPKYRLVAYGPIKAVRLAHPKSELIAVCHPSTWEPGRWQLSWLDDRGAVGDTRRDSLQELLDLPELIGYQVEDTRT
jgi:hypothetical protein